jgi:hypothetical protein
MDVRRIAHKILVSKPVGNKLLGRNMRRFFFFFFFNRHYNP